MTLQNMQIFYINKEPDDWFEENQQSLDEHGGMDDIQSLDVLLIPEITYIWYSDKQYYTNDKDLWSSI